MSVERKFCFTQEAWYSQPEIVGQDNPIYAANEVMIQLDSPTISGEFAIRWRQDNQYPRLEMYSDSWGLMPHFADLFRWLELKHDHDFTPAELCEALREFGMKDVTPRQMPKETAERHPEVAKVIRERRRPGASR